MFDSLNVIPWQVWLLLGVFMFPIILGPMQKTDSSKDKKKIKPVKVLLVYNVSSNEWVDVGNCWHYNNNLVYMSDGSFYSPTGKWKIEHREEEVVN